MPTKHALNVSLTEQLRDFVEQQVRSGRFQSASEVVRAALRLLQDNLHNPAGGQISADGIGVAPDEREPAPANAHRIVP